MFLKHIEQYIDSDYTGTVLLSGNWGVGKSSYINLVENYAIKNKESNKFIRLNFWAFSGEQTIYRYIFTNLYPRINIILNWLAPIVVALFFLLNNFINWMFSNPVNWNLLAPLLILTSIVTVFQDKAIKEGWYESSVTKKFKTKKGLDETNAMIKFLNGILFYENDSTKMIEILSETLKKLSVKRQVLVIKHLLANYKSKAGEIEEARKLYEEVIENGNKLYIVEEAKEKLNKM